MNKKLINKLAEQATEIVEVWGREGYTSSYARFDREKFAELIVRECANLADEAEPYKAADLIKKHFGVAEREE